MASITSLWHSFWHTMTSYDRHAPHDSPYRTGQHVPLAQSRHSPLTSVVTSAVDTHPDLPASDQSDHDQSYSSPAACPKPGQPNNADGIQMQLFSDGVAPPPPVSHSWQRIDRWMEKNYAELYDNVCEGCTQNDINELEHLLDHTLPLEVRDSLMCHDGQERGGSPSGILFGCMLLDCEEIYEEWSNWQRVGAKFFTESTTITMPPNRLHPGSSYPFSSTEAGPSSASGSAASSAYPSSANWRSNLMSRQSSFPEGTIQHRYTSPHWIPLARDWGGNCIAVDLAPGPSGRYGQVILFGRDFDTKILVARSWAAFLASVADDFDSGKAEVISEDDDTARMGGGAAGLGDGNEVGQLWLREFRPDPRKGLNAAPPIVPFMTILRIRAENRFGKRPSPPPRPRQGPLRMPAESFRNTSKSASKRPMVASPLSRVMEESVVTSGKSSPGATSPPTPSVTQSPHLISPDSNSGTSTSSTGGGSSTNAVPPDVPSNNSANANATKVLRSSPGKGPLMNGGGAGTEPEKSREDALAAAKRDKVSLLPGILPNDLTVNKEN